MEVSRLENLPPPPGIINSIKAGFDTIATHVTAIVLPLLLNLFMWLGPRLRMDEMFDYLLERAVPIWQRGGISAEDIARVVDLYERTVPSINLFWLLRTLPIGIPSLLLPREASATPVGDPVIWQVGALNFPVWFFLLIMLGWVGGAFYFRSVARISAQSVEGSPIHVSSALIQTTLISIAYVILMMVIGFPLLLILGLLIQLNAFLANLFVLFISLGSVWVIVPLVFWAHGVFLRNENVMTAMMSSLRLTRFTLPTSSFFVLIVFLLAYGLNFLWRIPANDSWMTLLGIFGHSFVTTALLAASFIYYRDMQAWLTEVLEKLRPNNSTQQA
jgi:hypothetical protein